MWSRVCALLLIGACAAVLYPTAIRGDYATTVMLGLAPLAIALVARWPFTIVAMFFAISAFRLHEVDASFTNLNIPFLLANAALAGLAVKLFDGSAGELSFPPQLQLFAIAAILICGGAAMAEARDISMKTLTNGFIKVIPMVIVLVWLGSRVEHIETLFGLMCVAALVLSAFLLFNKVNGIGLVEGTRAVVAPGRDSALADPNDIATYLIPVLAIAAVLAKEFNGFWIRYPALAVAAISLLGIVATKSRGGALGLLAVIGFLAWHWVKPRVLLVPLLAVAGIVLVLGGDLLNRSSGGWEQLQTQRLDASAAQRIIAWKAAINMAIDNPLTGIGIGGFRSQFYFHTDQWVGRGMAVHSSWFQVLGETGVITFAAFLGMIVYAYLSLARSARGIVVVSSGPLDHGQPAMIVVLVSSLGLSAAVLVYYLGAATASDDWLQGPAQFLLVVLTVCVAIAGIARIFMATSGNRHIVQAVQPDAVIARYAFALQTAMVGFCVAASFVTHAFDWLVYLLVGMSVIVEKILRRSVPATARHAVSDATGAAKVSVTPLLPASR